MLCLEKLGTSEDWSDLLLSGKRLRSSEADIGRERMRRMERDNADGHGFYRKRQARGNLHKFLTPMSTAECPCLL